MKLSSSPIQIEWFYYLEGEKTKLNWFLLEVALEYYSRIKESPKLKVYRKQYSDKQIAQYCTYYARRAKSDLLKFLKGRRKTIHTYQEYIDDFYPHHTDAQNDILNEIASEAYGHMLSACNACAQNCLRDYRARSIFFETYQ